MYFYNMKFQKKINLHNDITIDNNHKNIILDISNNKENLNSISTHDEMDYYDIIGDILIEYYNNKNEKYEKELKDINQILSKESSNNKNALLEKYYRCVYGTRIHSDTGFNRIKYCPDCNIEKILNTLESSYICPCCGYSETIIIDEDRQIKEYSPYKRINHFKEWLNRFQAKQTPVIPDIVFTDIINELNKNRFYDLKKLTRVKIKNILKKLNYNIYYEHIIYIINKLNNLPPPKITKDMEKIFINMFYKIQIPWKLYKNSSRKSFWSYSYLLYKFCELLDLNHLLYCFPLYKDTDKIIENDKIWKKTCEYLNWTYISSFK